MINIYYLFLLMLWFPASVFTVKYLYKRIKREYKLGMYNLERYRKKKQPHWQTLDKYL